LRRLCDLSVQSGDLARLAGEQDGEVEKSLFAATKPSLAAAILKDRRFDRWVYCEGFRYAMGDGIFTSRGEDHRTVKRAIQPIFQRSSVESWSELIREMARETVMSLSPGTQDLTPVFDSLVLRIAGQQLFGLDLAPIADELSHLVSQIQSLHRKVDLSKVAREEFFQLRIRVGELLHGAMRDQPDYIEKGIVFSQMNEKLDLTSEQIFQEFYGILMAGSLTTGLSLAAIVSELAQGVKFERIEDVMKEGLRKYPAAWSLPREAMEDLEIGGWQMDRGQRLIIAPWALHRLEEYFPDPEEFRPNRWIDGLEKTLPTGAYMPFGLGHRSCLGARMAFLEGEIILKELLKRFSLAPASGKPSFIPVAHITLLPEDGAWVDLQLLT